MSLAGATTTVLLGRTISSGIATTYTNDTNQFINSVIPSDSQQIAKVGVEIAGELAVDIAIKNLAKYGDQKIAQAMSKKAGMGLLNAAKRKGLQISSKLAGKMAGKLAVTASTRLAALLGRTATIGTSGGPIGPILAAIDLALSAITIGLDLGDPARYNEQLDLKTLLEYRQQSLDRKISDWDTIEVTDPVTGQKYRGKNVPAKLGGPNVYPYELYPWYVPDLDPSIQDEFFDTIIQYITEKRGSLEDPGVPNLTESDLALDADDTLILGGLTKVTQVALKKSSRTTSKNNNTTLYKAIAIIGVVLAIILLVVITYYML